MKIENLERKVGIPDNVKVTIDRGIITLDGPIGNLSRLLYNPKVFIEQSGNNIILYAKKATRREKRIMGTFVSHINNMIIGVTEGFTYYLKICSGHFPMKVTLENDRVIVSNFFGEKIPRIATVLDGVNVSIDGDIIKVFGIDLEKAGQTAANMERSTRITNRDRRVFMDGLWISSKPEIH